MQLQFQAGPELSEQRKHLVSFSTRVPLPPDSHGPQRVTRVQQQPPHPLKGPHTAHSIQRQGSASWGKRLSD